MESITNGTEDYLIDGLSFKLPPGASYVQDRKTSTFWAVGSNIYTPVNGVKLVKFQLNGNEGDWLDPKSVIFQFDLSNTDTDVGNAKVLRPLGGPHLFFKRLRVLAGGQVVEDIQDFNRYQEMVTSLMANNVRENTDIQGFGLRWDIPSVVDSIAAATADTIDQYYPGIARADTRTVNFKPLCGLLNQSKFLPLRFMGPLVFEFEIVDVNDAIVTPASQTYFTANNTTNNWQISNCCIKCDICTLDNALNNSYVEHLLAGKALPIEYSTYISQQATIASGGNTQQFSIQIIRAVSRLQRAFITFFDSALATTAFYKPSVTFHHPMALAANNGRYSSTQELTLNMQLGPKLYPEYPSTNIAEQFFMLKKALNLPEHHQHAIGIRYKNYIKDKFIWCVSFEKIPDAEWSGTNTKAGAILMVNGKAPKMPNTQTIGTTMYAVLEAQQILEIRDVGCTVYD
jgi:hypothetical protein